MEPQGFIYKLTAPDGKIYIGQTVDMKRRMAEHRRNKNATQKRLWASINKYGFHTHKIEILWEGANTTYAEMTLQENHFIIQFNSENPNTGLNCPFAKNFKYGAGKMREFFKHERKAIIRHFCAPCLFHFSTLKTIA